jgi:hypothetical protein
MSKLLPKLQTELAHYATNRIAQVRSCWVWTMTILSWHTIPPPDRDELLRIYGATVQRWERAMSEA